MAPKPTLLLCPHCEAPLYRHPADFCCAKHHSFPVAREGYVNLLGQTRVGDTAPMLAARRRFLDAGFFLPIAKALADVLLAQLPALPSQPGLSVLPPCVVDAGCGEGYYLGHLYSTLEQAASPPSLSYYGFDSAKEAVKLAARRYRAPTFFVGDINRRWHIASRTACAILNVFAPRNFSEYGRVLRYGGLLLTVIPTEYHLQELRGDYQLLEIEANKEARIRKQAEAWFKLIQTQTLHYERDCTHTTVRDVLTMTPNYWHLSERRGELTLQTPPRPVTFSVRLLVFQRYKSATSR